jgi:hypothetical protein
MNGSAEKPRLRKAANRYNFKTKPTFADIEEYLTYKKGVMDFIKARNKRIDNYANQQTTEQNASH